MIQVIFNHKGTNMKKLLFSALLFLTLTNSVFAFIPQMSFFVNREVATARIWNNTSSSFICSGIAYGRTYNGVVLNSWFNQIYVAPGMYADAYVYSNFYDPFVYNWAEVDCQFIW